MIGSECRGINSQTAWIKNNISIQVAAHSAIMHVQQKDAPNAQYLVSGQLGDPSVPEKRRIPIQLQNAGQVSQ